MSKQVFNPVRRDLAIGGAILSAGLILASLFLPMSSPRVFGQTFDNLILSRMGVGEILQYLEASDHNKGLAEDQLAAKYILGEIRPGIPVPARVALNWKTLPVSEQRQLKVIWFREHYMQLPIEDVGKYVNLDYLRARAAEEYRENPLDQAPKESDLEKELMKRAGKKKGLKKHAKTSDPSTDTALIKPKKPKVKKKPTPAPAGKPAAPVPTPPLASDKVSPKSDTPARPGSTKIPWYGGIPTKMKNE